MYITGSSQKRVTKHLLLLGPQAIALLEAKMADLDTSRYLLSGSLAVQNTDSTAGV